MKSLRAIAVICGLGALVASCGSANSSQPPVSGPIEAVDSFGRTLRIRLQPTYRVEQAFTAGLLTHIKDHPALSELRSRLGEPASRTDQYGEVWYSFQGDVRVVEAGREIHDSNGPPVASWYVYSRPTKPIIEVVNPALGAQLRSHPEASNLIVMSSTGDEAVSCELSKDLFAKCVWFTSAKERGRGL